MTTAQPSDMTQTSPPPPRTFDDEYYWDFVTFSVQGRLYRVPKYRFISQSEIFASKYGLDADSAGSELEYNSEEPLLNAVKLDVRIQDFGAFLKVLYPKDGSGDPQLSNADWLAVLGLATKWLFNDVRKMAIEILSSVEMSSIDKIILGRELAISSWLLSGYKDLVQRDAIISKEDAQKIEWVNANELWAVRERWRGSIRPPDYNLDKALQDVFSHEFDLINASEGLYMTQKEKEEAVIQGELMAKAAQEAAENEERAAKEAAATASERARAKAEHIRLEAEAAVEAERLEQLEQEVEVRRKKLETLASSASSGASLFGGLIDSSISETDKERPKPVFPGFSGWGLEVAPAPKRLDNTGWGAFGSTPTAPKPKKGGKVNQKGIRD